jgi:small subunit ribosomal protein S11
MIQYGRGNIKKALQRGYNTVKKQKKGAKSAKAAIALGLRKVVIEVRGPGGGRDGAIRSLAASGLTIMSIRDVSPLPHNGCRPPKRRRV